MSTPITPAGNAPASQSSVASLLREIARGLTPDAARTLRAVANTPEAREVIERTDAELQARRRRLLAELESQPQKRAAERLEAAATLAKATVNRQAAELALAEANTRHLHATGDVLRLQHLDSFEVGRLEAELEQTADHRLGEMLDALTNLDGAARNAFHVEPTFEGKTISGAKLRGYVSNAEALDKARAGIATARHAVVAMKRQPLSFAEVTAALNGLLQELSKATAELDLDVLEIDANGNVGFTRNRGPSEIIAAAADAGRKALKGPAKQ